MTIPENNYKIIFDLPNSFAANNGDKLSVKHVKTNGAEYYTGIVEVSDASLYNKNVTFTTNGFSPFVISAPAAFIDETAYPTLQEAVDNVKEGETIKLAENVAADTKVTVAKTVKFTVDTDSKTFDKDKNIVAGSNTTVKVTENSGKCAYEFTYSRPSHGGGSGGGSASSSYAITVANSQNGKVTSSHTTAASGTTVTLTVTPDKGYELDKLTVVNGSNKDVSVTEKNGKYTFTLPSSKVTVTGTFKQSASTEPTKPSNPFTDVPKGSYYEDAVNWAVDKGVTGGTSATTFAPNGVCTRAQAVTFLWRAAGSPKPTASAAAFTDVPAGSYYAEAVQWAVEKNITKGTSETTFSPDMPCSRGQIVTFLWRSQNSPAASMTNPFTDVAENAFYTNAVLWAVEKNVTNGTSATTFSPASDCTRAQIVTLLYRALGK